MNTLAEFLIIVLILLNFRLLGSSRLSSVINSVTAEALVLGFLPILANESLELWVVIMAIIAMVIKGYVLPKFIRHAVKESGINRELEPYVGYTASILIGAVMLLLCFLAANELKLPQGIALRLEVPATFFTMMTGLFLIVGRKRAITQVLGFLTMENGIYLFGLTFAVEEPLLVQLGVLLDVFAAVFVMGLTIWHISREKSFDFNFEPSDFPKVENNIISSDSKGNKT